MPTDVEQDRAKAKQIKVAHWIKEIEACRKREAQYRKDGQRILEIYDGSKSEELPFNILYSNTETLTPAVYSAIPRPVVQRRFKDDDPLGKAAAQAGQRGLEFLLDTNVDGYETFDDGMQAAALDALLPGRAVTAVVYDAEMVEESPAHEAAPGDDVEDQTEEVPTSMKSELVCLESKDWKKVYIGYAKKWSNVPWIAYESDIDRAEAERLFGAEVARKLTFAKSNQDQTQDKDEGKAKTDKDQGERETCRIYQVWDKDGGRKVRYLSDTYKEDFLKEDDDPLQLTGFFNCPKPLQFLKKNHSLTPTALYVLYESQAKELNELTRRIKMIARAIKARGIYDSELGDDLKKLMEADDNELVPADKSSSLAAEKGLQNAIWFMPIDQLIATLVQLYQAREQCKQVIYEITGISDILRGASKASETLGAQEIKTQWGTLRLKRSQKEVARYARDLLRLMLELAATKFSQETWAKMTGLPFLLDTKFNELTAVAQALSHEVQRGQATLQPPQPGAPPPPMPPQVQQLQEIQQQLQAPKWSDVLAMLRDDLQRAYRIDIETNSTVEPEAAEDQKNISDIMMAMGQVLNGIGPLVAKGVLPFEAAQVMLLTVIRRFRFGSELEDTIKAMQPPKPDDDGKGAELAQAQQQMAQMQQQMQQMQASGQVKEQQFQAEKTLAIKQQDLAVRELKLKQGEEDLTKAQQVAEAQMAAREQVHQAKLSPEAMEMQRRQLQADRDTAKMKELIHQDTELKKAEIAASAQIEVARISAAAQKERAEDQATERVSA